MKKKKLIKKLREEIELLKEKLWQSEEDLESAEEEVEAIKNKLRNMEEIKGRRKPYVWSKSYNSEMSDSKSATSNVDELLDQYETARSGHKT